MTNGTDPARRRLLTGSVALAAAALTPEAIWAGLRAGAAGTHGTRRERVLLDAVCEIVIPATDTPSATQARVPEFVLLAVDHRLADAEPGMVTRLGAELRRRTGRPFLSLDARRRHAVLEELDAEALSLRGRARALDAPAIPGLAAGRDLADWRSLKKLIVIGYYTSEPGATRELRYEFVPARYDADIPLRPGGRALMNDWWGNVF
jgi:hypothetical protein